MLIIWYFVTLLNIMFTLPPFTTLLKTNCKDTLEIGNILWFLFEHQILQTILGLHCFFICSEHIIAFLLPCLDTKYKYLGNVPIKMVGNRFSKNDNNNRNYRKTNFNFNSTEKRNTIILFIGIFFNNAS